MKEFSQNERLHPAPSLEALTAYLSLIQNVIGRMSSESATLKGIAVSIFIATFTLSLSSPSSSRSLAMFLTALSIFLLSQLDSKVASRKREGAKPDLIAKDWIKKSKSHAETTSDADVHKIWAKILAGEINAPGSHSNKTLSILADMTKDEAESFSRLCSMGACPINPDESTGSRFIVLHPDENSSFNKGSFSYDERSTLEVLGLINTATSFTFVLDGNSSLRLKSGTTTVLVTNTSTQERELTFNTTFTKYGRELARLCIDRNGRAHEHLLALAQTQGFETEASPVW